MTLDSKKVPVRAPTKKLLVYSTQLLSTGGIESHIRDFVDNVSRNGEVQIDLVVRKSQLSNEQIKWFKSKCRRFVILQGLSVTEIIKLSLILANSYRQPYDALYTNGQGNTIEVICKAFCYRRWVHHHHTSGDEADRDSWPPSYLNCIAKADSLIACSDRNAKDIQTATGILTRTIPCFSRDFSGGTMPPVSDRNKIRFAYFGRLIKEKGIEMICKLSCQPALSDIEFHIWGKEEQFDKKYFDRFPNVTYHGAFYTADELREIVRHIDAFLLLSVHPEGLPISLLEIMSAGIPWIATDRGGIRDISLQGSSTTVLPPTPTIEEARTAIRAMADNIRRNAIIPTAIQEFYRIRFSPHVVLANWMDELFGRSTANLKFETSDETGAHA